MPSWFYTAGWGALVLAGVLLETLALLDKDRGDTLSEHLWRVLSLHGIVGWMAIGAVAWAVLHIFWKMR